MEGVRRVISVGRRFQPNRLSDRALSQAYQPLVPGLSQRAVTTLHPNGASQQVSPCQPQPMPRRAAGGAR